MRATWTALAAALIAGPALADYPEKPVTIIVPFAAGGPTDKVARDLAEALRKPLGGTIVIENVGGVGGTLGAAKVAKAAADGYTLLLHHIGIASATALYRTLPYKTLEDFEYLGMVNEVPMTLIGRSTLPASNYAELAKWLEANKGNINLAHAGTGSASHLCGLMYQATLKIDMTTVPYKGTGPAMADVVAGQIDLAFAGIASSQQLIRAGKLKALGVTSSQRLAAWPEVPAVAEVLPGYAYSSWYGLFGPAQMPPALAAQISTAATAAVASEDMRRRMQDEGLVAMGTGQEEFGRFVRSEITRWGKVVAATSAKPE